MGQLAKLLPCAHECVCVTCAPLLVDVVGTALLCPLCRQPAREVWRVAGGGAAEAKLFDVNGTAADYARQLQYEHHVAAERQVAAVVRQRKQLQKRLLHAQWEAALLAKEQELSAWLHVEDSNVRPCLDVHARFGASKSYVPDWQVEACLEGAPAHMAPLVDAWHHSDRDRRNYLRRVVREHMGWAY